MWLRNAIAAPYSSSKAQPFAGVIADRYGSGRVIVGGALIFAAGTLLMAFATTPLLAHFGAGVLVGLGLVGLANVVGALTAGVLGDRFSKKFLLSSLYLTRAVVITLFMVTPPSVASVLIFAGAMGLLWLSTVPLTSALVIQMFGFRHMSMLLGIVFLSHQLGGFTGAWLGGIPV